MMKYVFQMGWFATNAIHDSTLSKFAVIPTSGEEMPIALVESANIGAWKSATMKITVEKKYNYDVKNSSIWRLGLPYKRPLS